MVPLRFFKDGRIEELYSTDDFTQSITDLCDRHRQENRALAFAFILYDFTNPQIRRILEDNIYWDALNTISGHYLSIYYIHSSGKTFAGDLKDVSSCEQRGMYKFGTTNNMDAILPILKRSLALVDDVNLPSVLFFQVEDGLVIDHFLVELIEEKFEESYKELENNISAAVRSLARIAPENYDNTDCIFECLRREIKNTKIRNVLKDPNKFPLSFLLKWVISKID